MKLKPMAVSVTCPVCKGKGTNIVYPMDTCLKCDGVGEIIGIILAPVGYDGTSEIEFSDESVRDALIKGNEILDRINNGLQQAKHIFGKKE